MSAVPVDVVGVRYAAAQYPWALLWLAERVYADVVEPVAAVGLWDSPPPMPQERCPVSLVREPTNPTDPNAIKVMVAALADSGHHRHVGYLPRDVAAVYADRMDRGLVPVAWIRHIRVRDRDNLSTPGLSIYVDWPDS